MTMTEELREDARATAEQVVAEAAQLMELERVQMDPKLDVEDAEELAEHSESLAQDIAAKTKVQKRLFQLAKKD
jgi:hypothetical protein